MKVIAPEPMFSAATIHFADAVNSQFALASRKSRPRWRKILDGHHEEVSKLKDSINAFQHCWQLPFVGEFAHEWSRNFEWEIRPSGCWDAIEITIPPAITGTLERLGIEDITLLIADLANPCCASLGNNDHNLQFGLVINFPVWIELASHDEHAESFEKQLGHVIHHEMAHFRHQHEGFRSEMHAHIRGLAWVLRDLDLPTTKDTAMQIIESRHRDIWANPELQRAILEGGEVAWRLLRLWLHYYKKFLKNPIKI